MAAGTGGYLVIVGRRAVFQDEWASAPRLAAVLPAVAVEVGLGGKIH
jgi:hypothetical protein